jgi:hypothetical protein
VVVVVSCGKYEYGPGVSLRTRKARISNTWVVDLYKENGIVSANRPRFELQIEKDGNIMKTDTLTGWAGKDSIERLSGLWEFDNKADHVLVLFANRFGIQESHIWRILKLANEEFWYEEIDSFSIKEYRLKSRY